MNLAPVEPIVNTVLYEGYMLYPYRPSSMKNRQCWTFERTGALAREQLPGLHGATHGLRSLENKP